jgi:hypothetical protein
MYVEDTNPMPVGWVKMGGSTIDFISNAPRYPYQGKITPGNAPLPRQHSSHPGLSGCPDRLLKTSWRASRGSVQRTGSIGLPFSAAFPEADRHERLRRIDSAALKQHKLDLAAMPDVLMRVH